MQTTIVYFTGTGNSLAVSLLLADRLPHATVVSANELLCQPAIKLKTDFCGFVFPVYCQDIPEIVHRLVRRIELPEGTYIFSIATHNGDPGFAHFTINKALKKKKQHLHAGFSVLMPGNCIAPTNSMNTEEEVNRRLNAVVPYIEKISFNLLNKFSIPYHGSASLRKRLKGLKNKFRLKVIYKVHQNFWTTEECNLCGLCAKICPENNITIKNPSPTWGRKCQLCMACIHWCPESAIQNGSKTVGLKRYHHPHISVDHLLKR